MARIVMRELLKSPVFGAIDDWSDQAPAGRERSVSISSDGSVFAHELTSFAPHGEPRWCAMSYAADAAGVLVAVATAISDCERQALESASSVEASALDHDRAPDTLPPQTLETGRAAE